MEQGETPFINVSSASAALNQSVSLADSAKNIWGIPGPLSAEKTYYIGKAWCFGTLGTAPLVQEGVGNIRTPAKDNNGNQKFGEPEDGGFTCDGTFLNNASQSDLLMGNIEFSAFQARNNPLFLCSGTPLYNAYSHSNNSLFTSRCNACFG